MIRILWLTILFFISLNCVFANPIDLVFLPEKWTSLSYNKIPSNKVDFCNRKLCLEVNKSAGPLVYKLDKIYKIDRIFVSGSYNGSKKIETSNFDEDSILRVGLVVPGNKKLSRIQRVFAAKWVKTLFDLAPKDSGLDKIYFLNISNRESMIEKSRNHPKSELIVETVKKLVTSKGNFEMSIDLASPLNVAAVWLSSDGDDSGSIFKLTLDKIRLYSNDDK